MDFTVKNYAVFHLGGIEVWITETIVNTWIIMGVLIIFAAVVRIRLKAFKDVPRGFQNVVEYLVEMFDGFLREAAGPRLMFLGNWFFAVFAFILLSNISGLFTLRPPTADWVTTFTMALVTFVLIHFLGGRFLKLSYLKTLIEPNPLFLPLNLIGELAKPISLSFRLFGNVLAGTILMSLIYGMAPIFVRIGVPTVLHFYFDLFAGAIQTYVFCILSLSFISASSATETE